MAAAEQPLKKRRLYDPPPSSPPRPPAPPSPAQEPPQRPPTPPPLSKDEIVRRRRSQEGIRNVFDCYKKIKLGVDRKDKYFTPELEEAYMCLITASGGWDFNIYDECPFQVNFLGYNCAREAKSIHICSFIHFDSEHKFRFRVYEYD